MTPCTVDWTGLLAARTRWMRPSALRQLLKLTARPGMISFAGGLPAAELFPLDRVADAVAATLKQVGPAALQYGETPGVPPLREWIARRYSTPAMPLQAANVLVTTGSQQVLDLAGRIFLNAGDRVIVENPTYLAALQAWRPHRPTFLPVEMDSDGLIPALFQTQLGKHPKLAYLMPNFQNPTGVTLTKTRRQELVRLLQGHHLAMIEDDPYEELRYEGKPEPSLLELDQHPDQGGHIIHAGTFSKTLMPGLRVGWAIGSQVVIEQLAKAKQAVDLHTSTFNQYVALALLNAGYLDQCLPILRAQYRERRDALLAGLQKYFPPGCTWNQPAGGMFVFVQLPRHLSAAALLERSLKQNVAFVPGADFYPQGGGENSLRLNFTKHSVAEIEPAMRRLGECCQF